MNQNIEDGNSNTPEVDDGQLTSNSDSGIFNGKLPLEQALQKLRSRLLDLTTRNRLLNYKHPKTRSLRFVGVQNLNTIYETLLDEEQILLSPVPEQVLELENGEIPIKIDALEQAKLLGINTSYDFEQNLHNTEGCRKEISIQTLFYPTELEKISKKISNDAQTIVEETGTNMLYLVFGFLEYYDSDQSNKALMAPILSIPVSLTRGKIDPETKIYRYNLSYSGEDVSENFTLREKLMQDFRIHLPELCEDEPLEKYFQALQDTIKTKLRWKIRRQLSLAMLSFGKLAIWADLDPVRSPELLKNELLLNLFEGSNISDGEFMFGEDYQIDNHPAANLPVIFDADSSQHSALIDAMSGKNMVINGPPGTGKSQTITNIIAVALAAGKRVLFVSEKLAALEVVRSRLDQAALGDFCLELHSHKTQKKKILEDIQRRLDKKYSNKNQLINKQAVLTEQKRKLKNYAAIMGLSVDNKLDKTVFEIFWAIEKWRQELSEFNATICDVTLSGAENIDPIELERKKSLLKDLEVHYQSANGAGLNHPWFGFEPSALVPGAEQSIKHIVENAYVESKTLETAAENLELLFHDKLSIESIEKINFEIKTISDFPKNIAPELLGSMFQEKDPTGAHSRKILDHIINILNEVSACRAIQKITLRKEVHPTESDLLQVTNLANQQLNGVHLIQKISTIQLKTLLTLGASLESQSELLLEMVNRARPIYKNIATADLEMCKRISEELAEYSVAKITLTDLRARANNLHEAHAVISNALSELEALTLRWNIQFDGTSDNISQLLDTSSLTGQFPAAKINEDTLRQAQLHAQSVFSIKPVQTLGEQLEKLQVFITKIEETYETLTHLAKDIAQPLDGTIASIRNLEYLVKIAKSAPSELLHYRIRFFEDPRMLDMIRSAKADYEKEHRMRSELKNKYFLEELPSIEEIKSAVSAFRQGDRFTNYFKKDWRHANKLFSRLSRVKAKHNSKYLAKEGSHILQWMEFHKHFTHNLEYKEWLGALFKGTSTNFKKVEDLFCWYQESINTLSMSSSLTKDFGLSEISAQKIAQLKVKSNAIEVAAQEFLSSLESTQMLLTPEIKMESFEFSNFESILGKFKKIAINLGELQSFFIPFVQPNISPKRLTELLSAKLELENGRELYSHLLKGNEMVLHAAGTGLSNLNSILDASTWKERLHELSNFTTKLSSLINTLSTYTSDTISPFEAISLLYRKQELDLLCELLVEQEYISNITDWEKYFEFTKCLTTYSQNVSQSLLYFSDQEKIVDNILKAIDATVRADSRLLELKSESEKEAVDLYGQYIESEKVEIESLDLTWKWGSQILSTNLPNVVKNVLLSKNARQSFLVTLEQSSIAIKAFSSVKDFLQQLQQYGKFDWDEWLKNPLVNQELSPSILSQRINFALAAENLIVPWSRYCASKNQCKNDGFLELIKLVEAGKLPIEKITAAFEKILFESIGKKIYQSYPVLSAFSGKSHDNLRSEFMVLDKEIINSTGLCTAQAIDANKSLPAGKTGLKVSDKTEMHLIRHELGKTRRHLPIRQLISRAGNTLQSLMPCFMMGPLAVAQYLEKGAVEFDLVIMDEASQLKPEDAIGAAARAKQLIVVGDSKQLPPTSFFDRMDDDDLDENDEIAASLDGSESILDICQQLFSPIRTLKWHYRSQHESLIAFSNFHFYQNNLLIFPSPFERAEGRGVTWKYVSDGVYKGRTNMPEAVQIVDATLEHMIKNPNKSLGIVSLNQPQRDLIADLLDEKLKLITTAQEYINKWEQTRFPFFVKNLENVQGDERDVIYISATYGKTPGTSKVRQNFGPISRADGWRRLNVLFTRARENLILFSSMEPYDLVIDEKSPAGTKALHDYLEFAKSGILSETKFEDREPDSDFEISVATVLRNKGYVVKPQLGVANFFIDMAVRNPDQPGEFLAAIECDGATYHSSASARDRDRIRQEILESLGWRGRIWRIWSTDWFTDPRGETIRLLDFLDERRHAKN